MNGSGVQSEHVLVCVRRMQAPLIAEVERACAHAGATFSSWNGDGTAPSLDRTPVLLVAGLPPGERRIPEEVVEVSTHAYPGLPLLLLCNEALLRPSISIQEGRVNLLGPPLSEANIAARIRALLSDRNPRPRRQTTLPLGLPVQTNLLSTQREERTRWWAAAVGSTETEAERADVKRPRLRACPRGGLVACVPLSADASRAQALTEERLSELVAALESGSEAEEFRLLEPVAELGIGLVHLDGNAGSWRIFWPSPGGALRLLSPLRLPNTWDFAARIGRLPRPLLRTRAASGDVLVAFSPPGSKVGELPTLSQVAPSDKEMANGGPAVLHAIENRLRKEPARFSGIVVEVL